MPATALKPASLKLLLGIARTASAPAVTFTPAPLMPPAAWFSDEAADAAPERFTVYPDGRVAGIVAPKDRCLLDGTGDCWMVPRPADGRGSTLEGHTTTDDYYIANQGDVVCDDGTMIAAAVLAGAGGHARGGGAESAGEFYADTADQIARIRYVWSDTAGNGVGGVVAVGALWPEITERKVAEIRASATSIDYRWILDERQYRLVGACTVNIGGLPTRYLAALEGGLAVTPQMVADLVDEAERITITAALATDPLDPIRAAVALPRPIYEGGTSTDLPGGARRVSTTFTLPAGGDLAEVTPPALTAAPSPQMDGFQFALAHGYLADEILEFEPQALEHFARMAAAHEAGDCAPCRQRELDALTASTQEAHVPPTPARTAAFERVLITGPTYGSEVVWPGGVGRYSGSSTTPEGITLWLCQPVVAGEILEGEDDTVAVPLSEARLTGYRFEYHWEGDDNAVVASVHRRAAVSDAPGATDAQVDAERLSELEQTVTEVEGRVARLEAQLVAQAIRD